jgi:hypothetical protein
VIGIIGIIVAVKMKKKKAYETKGALSKIKNVIRG